MTVQYSSWVASGTRGSSFLILLFRWRGSIYKAVWLNLTLYTIVYTFLSYMYRNILDPEQQDKFEKICSYCRRYMGKVPLSFILGFYVNIVMDRWWKCFLSIPRTDGIAAALIIACTGEDEKSRLVRRTIMRYANLSLVMGLQMISPAVKERFPTYEHMQDSGLLQPSEREIIGNLEPVCKLPKYWVPLVWATNIAAKARKQKRIKDDMSMHFLVNELCNFRTQVQTLMCYDWVCVPIVYTQVVTLAVYMYFVGALMGRQFLRSSKYLPNSDHDEADIYVPVFLFLEFFFYMGWLNVAESLINPFGHDDDDHDVNNFIDRNIQISFVLVDDLVNNIPVPVQDLYWNVRGSIELPYTRETIALKQEQAFTGSAETAMGEKIPE